MNLKQFQEQFSDEATCHKFFESIRWPTGRVCPHCGHGQSWVIRAAVRRPVRYECKQCARQFTVTTKTALHATKLPLFTWLLSMYLICSSSKGIASTILAKLIGTTQPTAWKIGHTIRHMMNSSRSDISILKGIIELDEKYVGGKPAKVQGVQHKRGKGTSKQIVLVAAQRHGPVRAVPIASEKASTMQPIIDQHLCKSAHLMSDGHRSYIKIGKQFAAHSHVNHSKQEYSRGSTHNNTAESFSSMLERARFGVFHYMSPKHLKRYLSEMEFRWETRVAKKNKNSYGKQKTAMKSVPVNDMLVILIMRFSGFCLKRTKSWGIMEFTFNL